jgi:choice-of-anchor A domain-containing protein
VTASGTTWTLTGTSSTLNVFNLNAGTYTGATINISAPAGSTVVVNVVGGTDSFTGGSINYTGVSSNDVLFNFNTASSLSLSNIAFTASILAPVANFTGSGGHVSGQLIAESASGTTEFESNLFTGDLGSTPAVPEPSTWLLFITGVGAMAAIRRARS